MDGEQEQRPRLLIVDDNLDGAVLLQHVIEHAAGARVTSVPNPEEALQVLGKQDFDLIIMDRMFDNSDQDGIHATRLIREIGITTRILIWTAGISELAEREYKTITSMEDVQLVSKIGFGIEEIVTALKSEFERRLRRYDARGF